MQHDSQMNVSVVYHRHGFPAEIISHCVWLYFRFALSFRDVEEEARLTLSLGPFLPVKKLAREFVAVVRTGVS
jgi:hypothetical protein